MPLVDFTPRKCSWCGHADDKVFVCTACLKYTCRDCYQGQDEAGCYHEVKQIPESKPWAAPDFQLEMRWADS